MAISTSNDFKQLITELSIDHTPAEFHGFLSGLIAGGIQDASWQTLTFQFINDGHAFPQQPLTKLIAFYQQLHTAFDELNLPFSLWTPNEDDGFTFADRLSEWASHFLLGLGLAQPKLEKEGEIGEAINDIVEISQLGYEEDDDPEELLEAAEEVLEYLRVLALFLHSHFSNTKTDNGTKLH